MDQRVPVVDSHILGLDLPLADRFFQQMTLIRTLERSLLDLFANNELFGTTHTCLGQEANAVGVVNALDRMRDTVWSNHRCHGHFLAYCGQAAALLAEIMGRTTGVCGGRGGSQHLCHGRFHSNGIQGGTAPLAVGTALADKELGAVSVVFLGDGTMGEGSVYEALNMAQLWHAPVLFVVENNGIAQTTPSRLGVAGDIADRGRAFGLMTERYAGADVEKIHALASDMVATIREQSRPGWLVIDTNRLGPHSKGDDTRSSEEVEALQRFDPIALQRPRLAGAVAIEEKCRLAVEAAIEQARAGEIACV